MCFGTPPKNCKARFETRANVSLRSLSVNSTYAYREYPKLCGKGAQR